MRRKLDDQAKIFSLSYNKRDTSIFRISATLVDNIDKKYLEQALARTLKKYSDFKVQLKKNLFWYFLDDNEEEIPIHDKIDYKFEKLNTKENNSYLFKVSYENNLLVVDFFHLLTDGSSGREFVKELLYNYLRLIDHRLKPQEKTIVKSENSYIKYYTKKYNKSYSPPYSYQLKGEYISTKEVSFNDFYIKLDELKRLSKEKECSLSILLISLIIYSLYETNYKKYDGAKPINVCIPINLRKYFSSDTISNFVSHAMLSIHTSNAETLDDFISLVDEEYKNKIVEERIKDTFESNGKSINNKVLNFVPLFLKRFIVILGSYIVKRTFTITFSNLGKTELEEEYSKYVDNITFRLIPDWAERIRCGVSSYKDDLIISFGTNLLDTSLELKFEEILNNLNVSYEIKSNRVNPLKKDS